MGILRWKTNPSAKWIRLLGKKKKSLSCVTPKNEVNVPYTWEEYQIFFTSYHLLRSEKKMVKRA